MSSTAPGPGTEGMHPAGNDDSTEMYLAGMSGDTEGLEVETPMVKKARAEALDQARAARAARAKYARLVAQQADVPNRNPNNMMQAESLTGMMAAQDDRIGRTEASLAATRIVDQFRSEFLEGFLKNEEENALTRAVVSGLVSYVPLVALKPSGREGRSFVSDPRVWSVGAIAVVTLADAFKGKVGRMLKDLDERRRESAGDGAKEVNTRLSEMDEGALRRVVDEFIEAIRTTPRAKEPSP
jgi:hypothetical protein